MASYELITPLGMDYYKISDLNEERLENWLKAHKNALDYFPLMEDRQELGAAEMSDCIFSLYELLNEITEPCIIARNLQLAVCMIRTYKETGSLRGNKLD